MKTTKLVEACRRIVAHTEYKRVSEQMERYVVDALDPDVLPATKVKWLLGPSRAGKSSLCDSLIEKYGGWYQDFESRQLKVDVLKVSIQACGSKSALSNAILLGLKQKNFTKGPRNAAHLFNQAIDKLNFSGVKLLIIDEIQSMTDGKDLSIEKSGNLLKDLMESIDATMVLVGLPSARKLMSKNEQLSNRSEAPLYFLPYNPTDIQDMKSFANLAMAYYKVLAAEPYRMTIAHRDFERALIFLTGGLVGLVNKFMRILADEHRHLLSKSGSPVVQIDLDLLYCAARKMYVLGALAINPFLHPPTDKDISTVWNTITRTEGLTDDMFAQRRLINA